MQNKIFFMENLINPEIIVALKPPLWGDLERLLEFVQY